MKKINLMKLPFLLLMGLLLSPLPALSQSGHDHGATQGAESREVVVDQVKISFSVMDNASHRKMLQEMKMADTIVPGTTHNISVTLLNTQTGKQITDAAITMRVVKPDASDEIKPLVFEAMMKNYEAYFSLPQKGRHQILVLIRIGDQKKSAGITYTLQ